MIINPYSFGVPYDVDAQNVISAIEGTGITLTLTQKNACNTLITDFKTYGLWTKSKAIYGMLGGTAAAHKFNWKDPRDLDAAFRLQFFGGWTHSSNGALPNGTNGYANTFFNELSSGNINSGHFSYYSRTNTSLTDGLIGMIRSGVSESIIKCSNLINQFSLYSDSIVQYTSTSNAAFLQSNRITTLTKGFRNGVQVVSGFPVAVALQNYNYYLGARNNIGTADLFSNKQCAFASIGDGLTDTEAANLYTSVQKFQTTLSRNI